MIEDCTAIIMAGGDSRRMGTDKANVTLGEKTLLQSVIATMQQLFPQVIVSVRQPRAGIDWPQVCDEQPDGGPLAGLVASLGQITTPWAFMVACDMPFVVPEVVELLAGYRIKPPSVPPCQGGGWEGLSCFSNVYCPAATIMSCALPFLPRAMLNYRRLPRGSTCR
jgi:molybdopterin-guanine dinucleotide biosynthesis protein A